MKPNSKEGKKKKKCGFFFAFLFFPIQTYFQILTDLSWLAEATIPVAGDCAKAEITHSWAGIVIHLFTAMFQSSKDCKQSNFDNISNI